jgi:hypothetical protein
MNAIIKKLGGKKPDHQNVLVTGFEPQNMRYVNH